MRGSVSGSLIAGMLSLAGCYAAHERPATSAVAIDASGSADRASADGGQCFLPRTEEWQTPCTPEIEATCQQRAMRDAHGRYGHSHCVQGGDGVHEQVRSGCSLGDYCPDGPTPTCRCTAGRICGGTFEVCVSDTPDGSRYCRPICP